MTLKYPIVMSEDATLNAALSGRSLARFGDGELRIALGRSSPSQRPNAQLAAELREILRKQQPGCIVCVPNLDKQCPRYVNWLTYAQPKYTEMYRQAIYGSSFITRPDNAPWIDNPDYWARMRSLWANKDVTLVAGNKRSLHVDMMRSAKNVRLIECPERDAYDEIDAIESRIGTPSHRVILCLGATATVLACRLAAKGVHALDIGHVGMFMRRLGIEG